MEKIYLVSFPKSGNTYLRFLLVNYFFGEKEAIDFYNINDYSPTGDISSAECQSMSNFLGVNNPIFIKLHQKYDDINKRNIGPEDIIVYVYRDPIKVLNSYFNFRKAQNPAWNRNVVRSIETYDQLWGSWGGNFSSWLRFDKKKYFLSYEDLSKNPVKELTKLIAFLGHIPCSNRVSKAVSSSSVSEMKKMKGQEQFMNSKDGAYSFVKNKNISVPDEIIRRKLSGCKHSVELANKYYDTGLKYQPEFFRSLWYRGVNLCFCYLKRLFKRLKE